MGLFIWLGMMITIFMPTLLGRNLQLAFVEEPELTLSSQTGVRELSPKAHLRGLELI